MVTTGEGKFDSQSYEGKVPVGVAERAKAMGVPTIVIAGDAEVGNEKAYGLGIKAIFSTNRRAVTFEEACKTSKRDLALLVEALFAFKRI